MESVSLPSFFAAWMNQDILYILQVFLLVRFSNATVGDSSRE